MASWFQSSNGIFFIGKSWNYSWQIFQLLVATLIRLDVKIQGNFNPKNHRIFFIIFPFFSLYDLWQSFFWCKASVVNPVRSSRRALEFCWSLSHCYCWAMMPPADIPSGKRLQNYGKSPFFMGNSTISMAIFNSKLLNYQRVFISSTAKHP